MSSLSSFDYIRELHDILWQFVYIAYPDASGELADWIEMAQKRLLEFKKYQEDTEGDVEYGDFPFPTEEDIERRKKND